MIYVGYPCVGKSSICGKNNNIDLESSNFFYNVKETGEYKRDSSWSEVYVNIAEDLDKQGFNVFVSSHGAVVAELKRRNIEFIGIFPDVYLKNEWIGRATKRYENNPCDKNKKALDRIISHFEEDIKSLKESCLDGKIMEINSYDYDLNELIATISRSDSKYKFSHCDCCDVATSGYCPISTSIGCVSTKDGVISNIEEFDKNYGE